MVHLGTNHIFTQRYQNLPNLHTHFQLESISPSLPPSSTFLLTTGAPRGHNQDPQATEEAAAHSQSCFYTWLPEVSMSSSSILVIKLQSILDPFTPLLVSSLQASPLLAFLAFSFGKSGMTFGSPLLQVANYADQVQNKDVTPKLVELSTQKLILSSGKEALILHCPSLILSQVTLFSSCFISFCHCDHVTTRLLAFSSKPCLDLVQPPKASQPPTVKILLVEQCLFHEWKCSVWLLTQNQKPL